MLKHGPTTSCASATFRTESDQELGVIASYPALALAVGLRRHLFRAVQGRG